jgi:hypothetical protein
MAIGARKALDKNPDLVNRYDGGELELIGEVIAFAQGADDLGAEKTFELEGVFVYEVAEPLGEYIVQRIAAGEQDLARVVQHHTAFLVAECCGQTLDDEQEQDR